MMIAVKRTGVSSRIPQKSYPNDAAFDLAASERVAFDQEADEILDIPTGLHIEIPDGVAGLILPRSSLCKKFNLWIPNAPGLIDPGFRGEVKVRCNKILKHVPTAVYPGERIAQLMFVHTASVQLFEADELSESERSEQGWGSSG